MSKRDEPDDVESFVGGEKADAEAILETSRAIEEYKRRPDYRSEVEEAERILAGLHTHERDHGMPDAQSLREHWQRCVADLIKADRGGNNGADAAKEKDEVGVGCGLPGDTHD